MLNNFKKNHLKIKIIITNYKNKYLGILSADNSNNGNKCNSICPTNKGFF